MESSNLLAPDDAQRQSPPAAIPLQADVRAVQCPLCRNIFNSPLGVTVQCPFCQQLVAIPGAVPDGTLSPHPEHGTDQCCLEDNGPDIADRCTKTCYCVLVCVIIACFITSYIVGALILLAIAPGAVLLWGCYTRKDRLSVRYNSVVRAFIAGFIGAIPIAIVELLIVMAWAASTGLKTDLSENSNSSMSPGKAVLGGFFMAFMVASFCEESLKYDVVRYHYNRPIFRHPKGLVVIGLAGALGFATIENIMYVLQSGWITALVRAVISVPLHALTGLIMGAKLAHLKYLPEPGQPAIDDHIRVYGRVMWLPILLHGFFNFPMMVVSFSNPSNQLWNLIMLTSVAIVIIAAFIYRYLYKPLENIIVSPV